MVVEIVFEPEHGKTQIRLDCVRETFRVGGQLAVQPVSGEGGAMRGRLEVRLPRRHLHEFLEEIVNIPAVLEIRQLPLEQPNRR